MAISKENYQVTTTDPQGMLLRINSILSSISDRLDKIEGIRGGSNIESNLDMNDNTIENVDIAATAITVESLTSTGDIIFTGVDSGLAYAEISVQENTTETDIVSQNVPVQVTGFTANGNSHNATPVIAENHILITLAGHYLIVCSATVESGAGSASKFEFTIRKNNGASTIIPHADRNMVGGGGDADSISLTGIADLAVDDTVEAWIENETNTQNYLVEDVSIAILQVGGA